MRKIAYILISVFLSLNVLSQEYSSKNKKAIAAYETALQNYQLLYYDKAEDNLKTALKQDEFFVEAYYLLAGVYTQKKDTTNMLNTLQTCVDKCGGTHLWTRYKLAYEEYNLGKHSQTCNISNVQKKCTHPQHFPKLNR